MFKPQTLLTTYGLAKVQDEYVLTGRRYRNASGNFATSQYANTMHRNEGFLNQNAAIGTPKAVVHVQKISQQQIDERRKKGLCYNCDAKWQYGHRCRNPKLFMLEALEVLEVNLTLEVETEDLMEVSYKEENPEISLHAITGSNHPNTMRLIGWVGNHKIIVSIDSGNTHNCLDSSMGRKLKVLISKEPRIRVKVANGKEVVSEGKCMQLKVQLHNFSFTIKAYMIILAGCDMVLGIQWLVTLGPIIWNFKVLIMEFTITNQSYLLQGLIALFLWEESDLMGSKRESFKGLFLHLLDNVEYSMCEHLGLEVEELLRVI
jgi:hypothetical protein